MRKTAIEIIEETVQYYSEDTNRRAKTSTGCDYYTSTGNMCAVGRCLINPKKLAQESDEVFKSNGFVWDLVNKGVKLNARLKKEYRNQSIELWSNLQTLHDNDNYWDVNSLSTRGEIYVKELKQKYNDVN